MNSLFYYAINTNKDYKGVSKVLSSFANLYFNAYFMYKSNVYLCVNYIYKSKVGDHSRGWPEGSLFDSLLHQGVGEGATPFSG